MKVIVRKNNSGAQDASSYPVVLEVRMSDAEAQSFALRGPRLEIAMEEALVEHLQASYRVVRMVETGRG